jgi:hypothetical protein
MSQQSFVLTDRRTDTWLESFELGPRDIDLGSAGWSVRKRVLRGGLSDGVEVVELDNGEFSFTILPTRGMGLWKGRYKDLNLGWSSPVIGPVHPKFVELSSRNGLGWLTGFDEWLCRCGLAWNGPPGDDEGFPLTLHGRIANQPAHYLEVRIDSDAKSIQVVGEVDEGGLFFPHLSLRTTYTTVVESNRVAIDDVVMNRSSRPTLMQLLYHLNMGPPLLGPGSRVHVPIEEMWPNNDRAAEGLAGWDHYEAPTSGFEEQVYLIRPRAGENGQSVALLHNAAAQIGVTVRWDVATLPYFNLWKNTAAMEDGYVTGLEPATGFPRFRGKERAAGRVRILSPGGRFQTNWTIDVWDTSDAVSAATVEVAKIQGAKLPVIHREPLP